MDMTILNIALPQMTAGLSPTSTQQLWIIDIYSLIQAGLLVSFAAIADCFGLKRMLMLGYSIFAVASLGVLITETPEAAPHSCDLHQPAGTRDRVKHLGCRVGTRRRGRPTHRRHAARTLLMARHS